MKNFSIFFCFIYVIILISGCNNESLETSTSPSIDATSSASLSSSISSSIVTTSSSSISSSKTVTPSSSISSSVNTSSAGSRIVGITNNSIYRSYVIAAWYPKTNSAFLTKDSGTPQSISFSVSSKISEAGNYTLEVDDADSSLKKTVNFTIEADSNSKETGVFYTNTEKTGTSIEINFEAGEYHSTQGRPTMGIWVEDLSGNLIHNIYISLFPGANISRLNLIEKQRITALPYWQHKAGEQYLTGYISNPENNIPSDIDAVTGATMKDGFTVYSKINNTTGSNKVKIFFEIVQAYDWGWFFTKENEIAASGDSTYYPHVGEPSLVYAVEVDLSVPGTYILGGTDVDGSGTSVNPVGYSDITGTTGTLYTDFYAIDSSTGSSRYKFDYGHKMTKKISVKVE